MFTMVTRSLGVVRISNLTDESTSVARQREIVKRAASLREGEVIGWAEDEDVSASKVIPTKRPKLKPWLTEPDKIEQYDEILFWRMDRFVRSAADLTDMIRWCEKHGKNLRSATESFDLSDPAGKAMAYIIAIFAEMESKAISTRVIGAQQYLREAGRWRGGWVPYGLQAVKAARGYVLAVEPEAQAVIHRLVEGVLAGTTVNALTAQLNAEKVPAPAGDLWYPSSVNKILTSPVMVGWAEHKGELILGEDGLPVQRHEPIIDHETWERVKAALAERGQDHSAYRTNANPLLGVAKCWLCGTNMTRRVFRKKYKGKPAGKTYAYYACIAVARGQCRAPQLQCDMVEAAIEDAFLASRGETQRLERRWVVGQGTPGDLEAATSAYQSLLSRRTSAPAVAVELLDKQLSALEERLAELEATPRTPSGWQMVDTGETWGDAWRRAEWPGENRLAIPRLGVVPGEPRPDRRQMLLSANLTARVGKPGGIFAVEFVDSAE